MRLDCPSCQAAYEVPAARLGRRAQRLRCARCGHVWSLAPAPAPGAEAMSGEPGPPLTTPVPFAETPRAPLRSSPGGVAAPSGRSRRARVALPVAWGLSIALLIGLGLAAWHWRAPVAAAWPPSARLYRLLGGA